MFYGPLVAAVVGMLVTDPWPCLLGLLALFGVWHWYALAVRLMS